MKKPQIIFHGFFVIAVMFGSMSSTRAGDHRRPFIRGDADLHGSIQIGDAIVTFSFWRRNGASPVLYVWSNGLF